MGARKHTMRLRRIVQAGALACLAIGSAGAQTPAGQVARRRTPHGSRSSGSRRPTRSSTSIRTILIGSTSTGRRSCPRSGTSSAATTIRGSARDRRASASRRRCRRATTTSRRSSTSTCSASASTRGRRRFVSATPTASGDPWAPDSSRRRSWISTSSRTSSTTGDRTG